MSSRHERLNSNEEHQLMDTSNKTSFAAVTASTDPKSNKSSFQGLQQENFVNPNPSSKTAANGQSQRVIDSSTGSAPGSRQPQDQQNNHNNLSSSSDQYIPSRKNAIILENIENVSQDQCLRAVADIIGGNNIHYCSRLSGGRICLYLTNESYVEKMCQESGVIINYEFIPCRRYVSEAKKVVVSNCPPELSDDALKDIMKPYGRIVSAPTRLRVTTAHQDLRHVKTWRRTIYMMVPDNAQEMPPRIILTSQDGLKQTLYIEKDDQFCPFCKVPGHPLSKCKKRQLQDKDFPEFSQPVSHRLHVTNTRRESLKPSVTSADNLMPQFNKSQEAEENIEPKENSTLKENLENQKEASQPQSSLWRDDILPSNSEKIQESVDKQNDQITLEKPVLTDKPVTLQEDCSQTNLLDNSFETQEDNAGTDTSFVSEISDLTSNDLFEKIITRRKRKGTKRVISPELQSQITPKQVKTTSPEDPQLNYSTSDTESCYSLDSSDSTKKGKKRTVRKELEALKEITEKLSFDESKLSSHVFLSFMQEARGKSNSKQVAARKKVDIPELVNKLNEAFLLCSNFNLQRRLKRAIQAFSHDD